MISGRVTNWVLRDTFGRLRVNVGVAYGSDVEKVREILESVAHEHPEVMAIWEPMDKLTEQRDGRPNMEFPHVQPLSVLG